jgi:RNA polymerase subunit RPABC4/transcription elongation factor Spt4
MNNITLVLKSVFPWMGPRDFWVIVSIYILIVFALAVFVYRDSKSRGGNKVSWLVWTILLGGILPFLFYLIVRSPYTEEELHESELQKEVIELQKKYYELMVSKEIQRCPVCGEEIRSDYMYCPHCFTQLKKKCPDCGRIVDKDVKICPYCGHIFEDDEKKGVVE